MTGTSLPTDVSTPTVDLSLMSEVCARYAGQRSMVIPLLQAAQAIYGYLPRAVLEHVARCLGVSLSKVYGVATFYSQFYLTRRGRHVLKLCDGTACHVKGGPVVRSAVESEFGITPDETTADGQLTLEIVYCMGSCALAPVAVLDGQVLGRTRQETLLRRVRRVIGER